MKTILMKPEGSVTSWAQSHLNLFEFFKNRHGLYVWHGFAERVFRDMAEVGMSAPSVHAEYFDFSESVSDQEIRDRFPENHTFGFIEGLALITYLIMRQWGCKEGALLINGRLNTFYLDFYGEVLVIGVVWDSGVIGWGVSDWMLGDGGSSSGKRVFCKTQKP